MKAITTKYFGPGNVRGSRFIASDEDGNRVIVSYNYSLNSEQNHAVAAQALCRKMGWTGTMMGGGVKHGMVWVWTSNGSPTFHVHPERKTYQPKTGEACSCKRGVERDNCPHCEGTGMKIDFAAIRAR